MKVTINDVARHAGVSIKTVSRVMNNEPSVRKDTVDKVQAAINELQYQPNAAARNLASSRSFSIGYIYDNPNAYYVIDMQRGLLDACRKHGYELLIHPTNAKSPDIVQEVIDLVQHSRLAGLVLTPPFSEMPHIAAALEKIGVHFVRIISGSTPSPKLSNCVLIDDFTAAFKITNHLLELGHTDIAFLCGEEEHSSSGERLAGYHEVLKGAGISADDVVHIECDNQSEHSAKLTAEMLTAHPEIDGILAMSDVIAIGAIDAARAMGRKVPDDLKIIGIDGIQAGERTDPPLTTMYQDSVEKGRLAAELALSDETGKTISLETSLLLRGSSKSI